MAEQYKGLYTDIGHLPPLYDKLHGEARALFAEKLSLLAAEVRVITPEEADAVSRKRQERNP